MKIKHEFPPTHVWEAIAGSELAPDMDRVVFTYGDIIYIPNKKLELPRYLMVHETVHSKQQGSDPDGWWSRYLDDDYFRIEQEVEAYAAQYRFTCTLVIDRNKRDAVLRDIARTLAGPMYGSVINPMKAMEMVKKKAGVK